ncbi:MAG: hypothetical protein ACOYNL_08925 [Rickettsiales bacterium]
MRQQNERFVCTLIDGDGHHGYKQCVVSGCHWMNRLGHLISTVLLLEGQCIEVELDGPV